LKTPNSYDEIRPFIQVVVKNGLASGSAPRARRIVQTKHNTEKMFVFTSASWQKNKSAPAPEGAVAAGLFSREPGRQRGGAAMRGEAQRRAREMSPTWAHRRGDINKAEIKR